MQTQVSTHKEVEQLDAILRQAMSHSNDFNRKLQTLNQHIDDFSRPQFEPEEDAYYRIRQLVLQLRLDLQDTIKRFLQLHHSYCQALGLGDKLNSYQQTLERIHYDLGELNLQADLNLLNMLASDLNNLLKYNHSLEKNRKNLQKIQKLQHTNSTINSIEKTLLEQSTLEKKSAASPQKKLNHVIVELKSAVELQAMFHLSLGQLVEAYQKYPGLPKYGIIYNYLAGLDRAFFQFEQRFLQSEKQLSQSLQRMSHLLNIKGNEQQISQRYIHNTTHQLRNALVNANRQLQTQIQPEVQNNPASSAPRMQLNLQPSFLRRS